MDLSLDGSRFLNILVVYLGGMTWDSPESAPHVCACSPSLESLYLGNGDLCGFGLRQRLPATPHLAGWPGSPGLGYFPFQLGHVCTSQERAVFVGSYCQRGRGFPPMLLAFWDKQIESQNILCLGEVNPMARKKKMLKGRGRQP